MAIEITAFVRGHLREAVMYALIGNPTADPAELTAQLLAEIGSYVNTRCRERDALKAEILRHKGRAS